MNRICFVLNENGELDSIAADAELEIFIVQPSCKRDEVYQYQSADFGPQFVHKLIGGKPVGHIDDDMLYGGTGYGKRQESRPKLFVVSED